MTHLGNLRSILSAEAIYSFNEMKRINPKYQNLANEDVQSGRAAIVIEQSKKPLHDYVPLYFGFKTPMVAFNQDQNEQLIFLRFPLDILETPGSFVADGNARSRSTKFYKFGGPEVFSNIDIAAVRTVKYAKDFELKRKKQSEVLIPGQLPIRYMFDIICYSENVRTHVLSILSEFAIHKPVKVNPGWYFEKK